MQAIRRSVEYANAVVDVMYQGCTTIGGFRVGWGRGKTKKGPSHDVIILSQP